MDIQMNPVTATADVPFYSTDTVSIPCVNIKNTISTSTAVAVPGYTYTINNQQRLEYYKVIPYWIRSSTAWTGFSNLRTDVWYLAYYGTYTSTPFLIKLVDATTTTTGTTGGTVAVSDRTGAGYYYIYFVPTGSNSYAYPISSARWTNVISGSGTLYVRTATMYGSYYTTGNTSTITLGSATYTYGTGSIGTILRAATHDVDAVVWYSSSLTGNYYTERARFVVNEIKPGTTTINTLDTGNSTSNYTTHAAYLTYLYNTAGTHSLSSLTWSTAWAESSNTYEGAYTSTFTSSSPVSTVLLSNLSRPILHFINESQDEYGYYKPWFISPVATRSSASIILSTSPARTAVTGTLTVKNNNLTSVTCTVTGTCRIFVMPTYGTTSRVWSELSLASTYATYSDQISVTLGGTAIAWNMKDVLTTEDVEYTQFSASFTIAAESSTALVLKLAEITADSTSTDVDTLAFAARLYGVSCTFSADDYTDNDYATTTVLSSTSYMYSNIYVTELSSSGGGTVITGTTTTDTGDATSSSTTTTTDSTASSSTTTDADTATGTTTDITDIPGTETEEVSTGEALVS